MIQFQCMKFRQAVLIRKNYNRQICYVSILHSTFIIQKKIDKCITIFVYQKSCKTLSTFAPDFQDKIVAIRSGLLTFNENVIYV